MAILLCPYHLEFLGRVYEVVRIRLGYEPPLIRLLDPVLVSLLLSEAYGVLF